jgi:hypothetical protein
MNFFAFISEGADGWLWFLGNVVTKLTHQSISNYILIYVKNSHNKVYLFSFLNEIYRELKMKNKYNTIFD